MSLITHTYAKLTQGEYNLTVYNSTLESELNAKLDDTCAIVEEDILKKLFGEVEYLNFQNNLTSPLNVLIINGYKDGTKYVPYVENGISRVYYGLKDMLSYFTYFQYIKNQMTFNSVVGEVKPNTENSTQSFPIQKMMRAYNLGVTQYYQAIDFINYQKRLDSTVLTLFDPQVIDPVNSFGI